jgi:hypothetical protein
MTAFHKKFKDGAGAMLGDLPSLLVLSLVRCEQKHSTDLSKLF